MVDLEVYGDKQLEKQIQMLYNMGAKTHNFRAAFNRVSKSITRDAKLKAKSFTRKIDRKSLTKTTRRGKIAKGKRTSGPIWRSIGLATSKKYKGVFWVGPKKGKSVRYDAWYAKFQESGTRRGIKPKLYMQQAYRNNLQRSKKLIAQELYNEIYKIAAKRLSL